MSDEEAVRRLLKWNDTATLNEVKRSGQSVLLLLNDNSVCSAWFAQSEPTNDANDDGEYDWVCCGDRFNIDGNDDQLIIGWAHLS